MMLYPAMGELNARIHNRYMLVNVVARRARQIAEAYESAHQPLDEKPVTMAINEVADGVLDDPEQMPPEPEAEEASDGAEAADDMEADDEESEAEADDGAEAVDEAEADGGAEAVDEEEPDGESAEGVEPKTSAEAD